MSSPIFPFKEMTLPFTPESLEPQLSASLTTMHYSDIYKRDLLFLNSTVAASTTLQTWSLREIILFQIRYEPKVLSNTVKFYASSIYNHTLYFETMAPAGQTEPSGKLLDTIKKRYGSVTQLKDLMLEAAATMLGPGWLWLNSEQDGNIHIAVTYENETPQLSALTPIFNIDLWEHAYMPQYGNRFDLYINNWFQLLNWDVAGKRFEDSLQYETREHSTDPNPQPPSTIPSIVPPTPTVPSSEPATAVPSPKPAADSRFATSVGSAASVVPETLISQQHSQIRSRRQLSSGCPHQRR